MEMCLYQSGFGYYVAGAQKFGTGGDFTTAPEISPVFGYCLANQAAEVLKPLGQGASILEIGAGSGKLAASMLRGLQDIECLPNQYYILELGTELQQRQRETLKKEVPELLERVVWLDSLNNFSLSGLIIANELLDAMPVRCFELAGEALQERFVVAAAQDASEKFAWLNEGADKTLLEAVQDLPLAEAVLPYRSELNPHIDPWFESISSASVSYTHLTLPTICSV